jgi:putative transcriptional regulator
MSAVDVKKLRKSMGLTQDQFCARFGFEVSTVRHWEQGQRSPTGPARVLLIVIERSPEIVCQAIGTVPRADSSIGAL